MNALTPHLQALLMLLTDLGDSAVLMMLVASISGYLISQGCRREALALTGAFLGASLGIALVKILLLGCGSALRHMGLRSPSGHSALSLTVFGTLGLLLANRIEDRRRYVILCTLLLLAAAIAISRVALGFHTKEEVLMGVMIGICMLLCVQSSLAKNTSFAFNAYAFVFMMVAVAFLLHGFRLPAEEVIRYLASHFRTYARCAL